MGNTKFLALASLYFANCLLLALTYLRLNNSAFSCRIEWRRRGYQYPKASVNIIVLPIYISQLSVTYSASYISPS